MAPQIDMQAMWSALIVMFVVALAFGVATGGTIAYITRPIKCSFHGKQKVIKSERLSFLGNRLARRLKCGCIVMK